ncbi:hypothetical protein DFH08DRAFT_943647 [Mycena albidolilacea]|uniref:F-box domain-containing protein n=1 Tax=Mycena albidolilacea TaxID=1033008 RepID=A0AAD6Z8X1_9AGAR|nr:hypothetical protein DFH08DRAFT_943647 [Mycena albidolilacea]
MNSSVESKFAAPSRCSECGASVGTKGFETFDMSVAPGTRHHALLNSNEPPNDSDSVFIQSVISKADAPLAYLDKEILKVQEKLRQMEDERAALSSYWRRNRGILSPLRRMPPELLREIFSWALPSNAEALDVGRFDIGQAPWLLTQISSRWRAIALSTPSLWSRIAIDYSRSQGISPWPLSPIKAQPDYSRKLKIHFYASREVDSRPQIDMFKLLSEHSARWEKLSVELTAETVPTLVALRDRVPSLRRLWIAWNSADAQVGVRSVDCFQTASSLVDIGVFNQFGSVPILLPGHQLTRYEIDCPLEEHIGMLKQTPNLVEARISIDSHEQVWPDLSDTVDLLRLRRMYISDPAALKYFKAPALEELALEDGPDHAHFLAPFHAFIDNSSCSLRRLCLVSPTVHTTTRILQSSPSLTELLIIHDDDNSDETNTLIAALTAANPSAIPLIAPRLRLIFFGCEGESHLDYTAYLEMLKSRRTAENCALKSAALVVVDGPKPEAETVRGLHTLRREGLDILLLEGAQATDEMDSWDYKTPWN